MSVLWKCYYSEVILSVFMDCHKLKVYSEKGFKDEHKFKKNHGVCMCVERINAECLQ